VLGFNDTKTSRATLTPFSHQDPTPATAQVGRPSGGRGPLSRLHRRTPAPGQRSDAGPRDPKQQKGSDFLSLVDSHGDTPSSGKQLQPTQHAQKRSRTPPKEWVCQTVAVLDFLGSRHLLGKGSHTCGFFQPPNFWQTLLSLGGGVVRGKIYSVFAPLQVPHIRGEKKATT